MKPIKISVRKIKYMLLLFPLLEPKILEQNGMVDFIFTLLKLFSFIWIILLYIGKRKKLDSFIRSIIACYFVGVISTAVHGLSLYLALVRMTNIVVMVLLVKMMLDENAMFCFDVFLPLLEFLLYANLLSIFLFPNGMYTDVVGVGFERTENWLLGLDNDFITYLIAGISVAVVRDYYRFGKLKISIRSWCLIAVCYATVFIRFPATALVGMFIILPAILMPKIFTKNRFLNIVTYLFVALFFFFSIVIFRTQNNSGFWSFLIQGVLHKSLTFSRRIYKWDNALTVFAENPVLGIGVLDQVKMWEYLGQVHAHNIILQMLVYGGILQLGFFLIMHLIVAIRLMENNHNGIASFLSVVLFSMLIMNQVEVYQSGLWYMVYAFAFYSGKIITQQKNYQYMKIGSETKNYVANR